MQLFFLSEIFVSVNLLKCQGVYVPLIPFINTKGLAKQSVQVILPAMEGSDVGSY